MADHLESERNLSLVEISPSLVQTDATIEGDEETKASSRTALVTRDQILSNDRGVSAFPSSITT
jgi:hypothetical protein